MILIYSTLRDPHALAVAEHLQRSMDRDPVILDLAQFPAIMRLTSRFANGVEHHRLRTADGRTIDQDAVRAVWWRRPQPIGLHAAVRAPLHREFAHGECTAALNGFWLNSRCLWVNPIEEDRRASRKGHQLAVARSVGLDVPDTLITNDPAEARAFWDAHDGQVVYKAFMGVEKAWRETRMLTAADLKFLANVRYAPAIFQEYLPAGADLRVTLVGSRLFAAEVHSATGSYPVDVRMDMTVRCRPTSLPADTERALFRLIDFFGLEYGAIDMRRTPEGRHCFLEINPAGQYLYVEKLTGLPISRALAEHLAEGVARAPAGNWGGYAAPPRRPNQEA